MSKVPYLDLAAQYQSIKPEIAAAIAKILDTQQYILGDEVKAFEEGFARAHGATYGIGVNTGTSALHLALLAAGIGPGDEVITTPFTFVATTAAIVYAGAKPVFVDIDPASFTIDVARIEAAITPRTRAIVPVHLYGQPADMDPIVEIADRNGLVVIEDACQAHVAEYKGRRVGSIGAMGCFSFYPGKNLGAYGEGGALVTNSPDYAHTVRSLRSWGEEKRYHHSLKGYNYRMDGLQGAILGVKLRCLDAWTESRRAAASRYDALLADAGVQTPPAMAYARHVYHVYAVRSRDRAILKERLESDGVATGIHYPIPVHLQEAYADLGHVKGDFPEAERAAEEVLSLPMFPELTEAQTAQVAAAVQKHTAVHAL